ncbi:MAG: Fe-S oxidoreductase [Alphaproteobacteria bacterium]|nr:Fe-S oxidoreductase [Alphaproteobacteria bacterium]
MPPFLISLAASDGSGRRAVYDPWVSRLTWEDGAPVSLAAVGRDHVQEQDKGDGQCWPEGKAQAIRRLKIQLGLGCNQACAYCLQRFQPAAQAPGPADVASFLDGLPRWFDGGEDGLGQGVRIEFWGGEPFLYWRVLRPLGDALKAAYPNAVFSIVTNGTLLDGEKIDWLERMGALVGISHDGPGQNLRGSDPFDDPKQRHHLLDLYDRLALKGRLSFNNVLSKDNHDLGLIRDWFKERLEGRDPALTVEGIVIPHHMEDGSCSPQSQGVFIRSILRAVISRDALAFTSVRWKLNGFFDSLAHRRPASALGQKCSMERRDHIAVDLKGFVLTCQNVSALGTAPNGRSHCLGSVTDLDRVRLTSARHWSQRPECVACPVLQFCQGSCMFLEGAERAQACANEFSWNMGLLAGGLYLLTGLVPVHIEPLA